MSEPRINLSQGEKLAREISGIESNAIYSVPNAETMDEMIKREAVEKFNTQVDEYVDKFNKHAAKLSDYAKYINESMNKIEIKPILNYALIRPFDENPFQRIKRDEKSGLIIDLGGQKPTFKNQDNGQVEEEENFIHVGTVIEVGSKCQYLLQGDIVMWTKVSEVPVPFYRQGLVLVNELRIMVVINEGLTERFKNIE